MATERRYSYSADRRFWLLWGPFCAWVLGVLYILFQLVSVPGPIAVMMVFGALWTLSVLLVVRCLGPLLPVSIVIVDGMASLYRIGRYAVVPLGDICSVENGDFVRTAYGWTTTKVTYHAFRRQKSFYLEESMVGYAELVQVLRECVPTYQTGTGVQERFCWSKSWMRKLACNQCGGILVLCVLAISLMAFSPWLSVAVCGLILVLVAGTIQLLRTVTYSIEFNKDSVTFGYILARSRTVRRADVESVEFDSRIMNYDDGFVVRLMGGERLIVPPFFASHSLLTQRIRECLAS